MPRSIADAVRRGLLASPKWLPPALFYDDRGSALFDRITELPEYYVTRTERRILDRCADAIAADLPRRSPGDGGRGSDGVAILELGAGSASKALELVRAVDRRLGRTRYFPADISAAALAAGLRRWAGSEPRAGVTPIVGTHDEALARLKGWRGALAVLFVGSSIGNYDDDEAASLLRDVRRTVGDRGALVLGTDLRKPVHVMLSAYDDAQGVTAAFNKNVLVRINRELGGAFDVDAFRHLALWNEQESRVEMHLQSARSQSVPIAALGVDVHFDAGERIHTESSRKYDYARADRLLARAGLRRRRSFTDERAWFAVHVALPAQPGVPR